MLTTGGGVWPLPAAPAAYPFDAITTCVTPTYDGSGAVTHPSVVDMGRRWNGYRWWLADTPYDGQEEPLENPSIWGSNDRINWEVPDGLTNPIDPWPGGEDGRPSTAFNSDVELVWDPDGQRMICFWRDTDSFSPEYVDFYAATSTNGWEWPHHPDLVAHIPFAKAARSPGIARIASGDWRMWALDNDTASIMWTAPHPFGPWTEGGNMTLDGSPFMGWHGDFIHDQGIYYGIVGDDSNGPFRPSVSLDGLTWYGGGPVFGTGYRATMLPPRNGEVEVWYSKPTPTLRDFYTRIPASYWTDLLPQ